jgi:hypothetical protein
MKMIRLNSFFAILIAVAFISSCKKDSSSSGGPDGYIKPSNASQEAIVELPSTIQNAPGTDANLTAIKGYATVINSLNAYTNYLANVPGNATESSLKSTTRTWSWSGNGFSLWVEFTDADLQYLWKLYLEKLPELPKTKYVEATELKTGLGGTLTLYSGGTAALLYTWTKNVNGDVTASIAYGTSNYWTYSAKADGSGSFTIYTGTAEVLANKLINVTWTSDGHGTWYYKNGTPTNGTW